MRLMVIGLLALSFTVLLPDVAHAACPDGYVPCGRGVCCPR